MRKGRRRSHTLVMNSMVSSGSVSALVAEAAARRARRPTASLTGDLLMELQVERYVTVGK